MLDMQRYALPEGKPKACSWCLPPSRGLSTKRIWWRAAYFASSFIASVLAADVTAIAQTETTPPNPSSVVVDMQQGGKNAPGSVRFEIRRETSAERARMLERRAINSGVPTPTPVAPLPEQQLRQGVSQPQ